MSWRADKRPLPLLAANVLGMVLLATIGYRLLESAGHLSALPLLLLDPGSSLAPWMIYFASLLLALSAPLWAWRERRLGRSLGLLGRVLAAEFILAFCMEWVAGGTLRVSGWYYLFGFCTCAGSAVAFIVLTVERGAHARHDPSPKRL